MEGQALCRRCEKKAVDFKLRLDESESKRATELERTSKQISGLEAEVKMHKEKRDRADAMILKLEASKARRDAYIAELTRLLETEKALHEIIVKRAVKEARRETAAKFQKKVSRAEEKISKLDGQPKQDMVDLAQIEGNLQFIELLRGEEPPSLDAEVEQLTHQRSDLEGAYEEFAKLVPDLKEDLRVYPVSPISVNDHIDGEPIVSTAATVGVRDFSGSNRRTSGIADLGSKATSEY